MQKISLNSAFAKNFAHPLILHNNKNSDFNLQPCRDYFPCILPEEMIPIHVKLATEPPEKYCK